MADSAEMPMDVATFLANVDDDVRREDAQRLTELMAEVTGEAPWMWGKAIVAFGSYRYRYESGREGDSATVGFSPRTTGLTLYLAGSDLGRYDDLLADLGPHKRGKGCLYVKRLSDVDEDAVRRVVERSRDTARELDVS